MYTPSPQLIQRLAAVLGQTPTAFTRVHGGYTPAERWLLRFDDGSTAFVKVGTTPLTAAWIRDEQPLYAQIQAPFMPRYLGWDDDQTHPFLVLEDLSQAHWPPPWDRGHIDAILSALEAVHGTRAEVPSYRQRHGDKFANWQAVAEDPAPFLSLGLVTPTWLDTALPDLIAAEQSVDPAGPNLTHFDIRSDNICLCPDRALLIDWNHACCGNPRLDLGFWLPSLAAEGGPPPESILPNAPDIAATVAGFFAARAGQPPIPDAPRVRHIQQVQLKTALPWAIRALEL